MVKHKNLFAVISIFCGVLISLLLMEVALRIAGIGYMNGPLESDPVLHHVHPRDYEYVSSVPGGEYGGHRVYYDENGLVSDPERKLVYRPSLHTCKVAVMGDSFVEARQVSYLHSFVGQLNRSAADNVFFFNYGVSSYSPILYLLQWRGQVSALQPQHVIELLYSNDVHDDNLYLAQSISSSDGEIVAVPGPGGDFITRQLRKSYVLRFSKKVLQGLTWLFVHRGEPQAAAGGYVEEAPSISGTTDKVIKDLAREVKAAGAKFTLMSVPSKAELLSAQTAFPDGSFADKADRWARQNGIDFVDLRPAFRSYVAEQNGDGAHPFFKEDIHFNEIGNALVAKEIQKHYPQYFGNRLSDSRRCGATS